MHKKSEEIAFTAGTVCSLSWNESSLSHVSVWQIHDKTFFFSIKLIRLVNLMRSCKILYPSSNQSKLFIIPYKMHLVCTWKICKVMYIDDRLMWRTSKNWGLWSALSFNATRAHSRLIPLAACGDLGKPDLAGHNNKVWGRVGTRCTQGHVGRRATPVPRTGERQVWEKIGKQQETLNSSLIQLIACFFTET